MNNSVRRKQYIINLQENSVHQINNYKKIANNYCKNLQKFTVFLQKNTDS